ncbi:hypothetical protein MLD38_009367 [Melastoma candidum]|uniref:Uncharacterized protein n=1 Tax=Melastoma candidum TaxID=119954 RepID=A0ACB9RXV8_9MYRT|nr:hypothetical protein MLD38_009367 [Melastoma candidum]
MMESSTAVAFLVALLVLSQSCLGSAVHMRIDNRLGPPVGVYCNAEDGTQVGYHVIPNQAYWKFSIYPNPQRTSYQCNFKWAGESHDLRIYDDARGLGFDTYHWALNENGACLLMDSIGTWQCYSWLQSANGN